MLTVRELTSGQGLKLLAGEPGIDLPVRWVHLSELPDPTPWLTGGEVMLSHCMALETAEQQREYIDRLADHRLAGLGLGTGVVRDELPQALIDRANEREFPVFEVPREIPFIAITEMAFSKLVNEQYAVLRRALSAQERLERIVLSERGLEALAATLSTLVGAAVVIFDGRGEMLTGRAFRRELDSEEITSLRAGVRERIANRDHQQFMPAIPDPARGLVIPVAADGISASGSPTPEAWLAAIKDDAPLSDFDRLALRQAVTIVALELLRARVAGDTERRLAGDLLAGLLAGELAGPDLARRLEPFGINDTTAALVFQRDAAPPAPAANGGTQNGARANRIARPISAAVAEHALANSLRGEATNGLIASADQVVGALIPGLPDDDLFALAERVAERLQRELPDEQIRLGVGRAVPAADAKRSFHEARCAVEAVSFGLGDNSKLATYRDLGSFQLLLSLQDDEALKLFCDSILGAIEQSEGYYGGELMRSLEAFIEENGQWERAAKRLYCHRHTLRYRIRRVEELTGRNLGSARDRIEFWLALRGRELIS